MYENIFKNFIFKLTYQSNKKINFNKFLKKS
jgi:hypothetical protein